SGAARNSSAHAEKSWLEVRMRGSAARAELMRVTHLSPAVRFRRRFASSSFCGTDRPAVAKIFAGDAGYLGRTREIDDGLGAFLRRLGAQRHGHPHHKSEPVIVALAETGGDEPRVQAVGGDAGAGEQAPA